MSEDQEYDPDPDERRPFDPRKDDDLREHGYVAVFHSSKNHSLRGDAVGVCMGVGPAVSYRPATAVELANDIENDDGTIGWLEGVPDPEALADDLRELAEIVQDAKR